MTALTGVFEPFQIGSLTIRNRFVRSATYDGLAETCGAPSERQIRLFKRLAEGGVGLIVTGIFSVHHTGQVSPFQNSIQMDETIERLQRLTGAVHERGAKIAVQLFHGGREAKYVKSKGCLPLSPFYVEDDPYYKGKYRTLHEEEIWEIIESFGDGAKRAKEAGFDAIQVHGAHAYLLSEFLSPYTNRRKDRWGGKLNNRLRFHREIYRDIRNKVGREYPVLIKFGVADGFFGGLEFNEGKEAALRLARLGFDSIEVSQGLRGERYEGTEFRTGIDSIEKEAYFRTWCSKIKKDVQIPVMMVGGLRSLEVMESIIQKREADLISISRPLIREPDLINRWVKDARYRAKCTSCNRCLEALYKGEPLHCVLEKSGKR